MFLPVEQATAVLDPVSGNWKITFQPKPQDRWLISVTVTGAPPGSTIRVQIEGESEKFPVGSGPANSLEIPAGVALIPAGQSVFVFFDLGTGTAPRAVMETELSISRGWQDLESAL